MNLSATARCNEFKLKPVDNCIELDPAGLYESVIP